MGNYVATYDDDDADDDDDDDVGGLLVQVLSLNVEGSVQLSSG